MEEREHNLKMEGRKYMQISGVLQADSSEEKCVNLKTTMGDMVIEGEDLQIRHLDLESGNAIVGGKVHRITYPTKDMRGKGKKRERGLGNLFK